MAERFSASAAGRHMGCHASANLPLAIPGYKDPVVDDTPASAAGTMRHKLLEPIMSLTTKEIDGFAKYLQYVADLRKTRRFKVLVEQMMVAEWLDTKPKTTADLVLYTQDEIHILDGKWGKIPVYAQGNVQLMFYAVTYAVFAPRAKKVTVHILQPLIDNYDSWEISTTELRQFMEDALAAERAIQAGDTTFAPGDHCTFCPANPHGRGAKSTTFCPELMSIFYPKIIDEDAILDL